jgi:hypothetical protein
VPTSLRRHSSVESSKEYDGEVRDRDPGRKEPGSVALRQITVGSLMVTVALCAPAARGEEALPSSAEAVSPILVGTTVPDGVLRTAEGRETTLRALLDREPAVLVFYRGHW